MQTQLPGWTREEIYYVAERGYRLYCEGRLRDAGILFEGLTVVDPENQYCRKALAAIRMRLNEHDAAVRNLTAILARDSFDREALAGRCETLVAMNDHAAARLDLESLSALPGGADDARRLRLLLHHSELIRDAQLPQLPSAPPR